MKKLLICTCVFLCAVAFLTKTTAKADSVTDTISVYIGYFGWQEDEFVEKATYNWRELDDLFGGALTTHEVVYSYCSGSRTYLAAARGFYIRDLLEYAGVDFSSISRIDFFTKDQTVGAYRSFTKASLFDLPRYYFPNMAINPDTGELYPFSGDDIYDGSVRVEAMLALEDYTEWDAVGSEFETLYDRTMFSSGSRFHLFFGQLAPDEANTSSAAKYVYRLFITFSGTPVLSTDTTNIELKVGSDFKMNVTAAAEDALLDEYVRGHLVWSSSDESIVSVDSEGNLTVNAEGEAVITASFGEVSVSANVRVSSDASEVSGSGSGTGNDNGGGAGSETEVPDEISAIEVPASQDFVLPQSTSAPQRVEVRSDLYELSAELLSREDFAAWLRSVRGGQTGGREDNHGSAMDEDTAQLILLDNRKNTPMLVTAIALASFFTGGIVHGAVSFRRKLS